MGHPSVHATLRGVRPDGTPVYGYAERPGRPPISMFLPDGRSEATHGERDVQRHTHDFHALVYIERGDGSVTVDGRDVALRPGDLYAVRPGHVIDTGTAHERADDRTWTLAFAPDAIPALASLSPLAWDRHPLLAVFAGGRIVVPAADRRRWVGRLGELEEELCHPDRLGAYDAATALLTGLLVDSARLASSGGVRPEPLDPLVVRVFEQIEAVYPFDTSASEIARSLGYTPGHLTTALRRRTGRTLLDWLTERRLTEVRRLLRDTDLPLGAIAARTGLGDASYLVRRFRRRYGVTPDRWRRGLSG